MDLPATPDEIDAEWLDAALHAREGNGIPDDARVIAARSEDGRSAVGLMGEITRFHLTWQAPTAAVPSLPRSVIVKTPSALEENRALALAMGFYEIEHRFYDELAHDIGMRTPHCWYTAGDVGAGRYVLVLEDIAHLDRVDQMDGLDATRTAAVIEVLAATQARWWNDPSLAERGWIVPGVGDAIRVYGDIMAASFPAFADAVKDVVDPEDLQRTERFIEQYGSFIDDNSDPPTTLTHRDFRVDNMHFDGLDPVVFDWGGLAYGLGAYDLAYFLGGSVDSAIREIHLDRWLRKYHEHLLRNGVTDYPWTQFRDDLNVGALYCLIVPVMTGGDALDARDEQGEALIRENLRRTYELLGVIDAWSALPN